MRYWNVLVIKLRLKAAAKTDAGDKWSRRIVSDLTRGLVPANLDSGGYGKVYKLEGGDGLRKAK